MSLLTDISDSVHCRDVGVATDGTPIQKIVDGDLRRYAIGFAVTDGSVQVVTCNQDPNEHGGFIAPTVDIRWLNVKDHGSLPQLAWYVRGSLIGKFITVYLVTFPRE